MARMTGCGSEPLATTSHDLLRYIGGSDGGEFVIDLAT